jgi:hypothetical protein
LILEPTRCSKFIAEKVLGEDIMAKPLDSKEIVTVQELAVSNMLELETLRQLLFERGIITKEEFIAHFKKLDREMKERRRKVNISFSNDLLRFNRKRGNRI